MVDDEVAFLWDNRPGENVDHIKRHGMTTELWERVFHQASKRRADKDDATIEVAEGRIDRRLYRIVYELLSGRAVRPIEIYPISGYPINRRAL